MARATVLAAALLCAPLSVLAQSAVLADHTFRPPFNTFDSEGRRLIPNFSYGGNVDVNENFIRVTPDRAVRGPGHSMRWTMSWPPGGPCPPPSLESPHTWPAEAPR